MTDTITAISTAVGNSGISIIRISGEDAYEIIGKLMRLDSDVITTIPSHSIKYGHIYNEEGIVDEVLVSFMKTPRTYTREDIIEINCHGGRFITKKILSEVIKAGARLADPGEFTKRAFLNGRIDLTQAEAVMDVIQAESEYALKSAERRLIGGIEEKLSPIKESILSDMAYIEAALDDPWNIPLEGKTSEFRTHTEENIRLLEHILSNSNNGRIIKDGIKTVIIGKPNVGKSSFLNYISGEEVAIVTDIAGTTRDAISTQVNLGDISLNIVDTAGIRDTDNVVEKIGIDRAKKEASRADLILFILDSSVDLSEEDKEIMEFIRGKKAIVILNKTDLLSRVTRDEVLRILSLPIVEMSAAKRVGLETLEAVIKEMFFKGEIDFNNEIFLANLRQEGELKKAVESLKLVLQSIEAGVSEDFYTIDLMAAYEALGAVTGDTSSEDLANKIFSDFCMGK